MPQTTPDLGLHLELASRPDMAWIYNTWVNSFVESPYGQSLPWHAYRAAQIHNIGWLLSHGARVYVARGQVPGWIAGWVCCQLRDHRYVLHYAYVRGGVWRKQGIGTFLIQESAWELNADLSNRPVFTHYRQPGASLLLARGFECKDEWGHA